MRSVNHELEVRAKNTSENVCHKCSPRWMRMCRGSLLAVFNFSGESCAITLPEGNWHPHLSGNAAAGAATFPPKSTTVLTESVGAASSRCRIPSSGMDTHPGRLFNS